ncbi:hypothetical protein WL28_28215 [Burkholderia ubonensis]|nr:hypothetical protein WL28_28215 [Burkholderia ubonensis]
MPVPMLVRSQNHPFGKLPLLPVAAGSVCVTALEEFVMIAAPRSPVTNVCALVTTEGSKLARTLPLLVMAAPDAWSVSTPPVPPTLVTVPPPPPLPGGTAHVESSRRKRVVPAVAPGSGTPPVVWLAPEPVNGGMSAPTSARISARFDVCLIGRHPHGLPCWRSEHLVNLTLASLIGLVTTEFEELHV